MSFTYACRGWPGTVRGPRWETGAARGREGDDGREREARRLYAFSRPRKVQLIVFSMMWCCGRTPAEYVSCIWPLFGFRSNLSPSGVRGPTLVPWRLGQPPSALRLRIVPPSQFRPSKPQRRERSELAVSSYSEFTVSFATLHAVRLRASINSHLPAQRCALCESR